MDFTYRPIDAWRGERTKSPRRSQFRAGWSDTLELLKRELRNLRAAKPVIQIDLAEADFRVTDGLPRASARPASPAVIISFESRYGPLRYCCNTYTHWQDNVRAIAMTLENLRACDRYGATHRGEQYTGWKALPGPAESQPFATAEEAAAFIIQSGNLAASVSELLGASPEGKRDAYRSAAKKLHPDNGGLAEDFQKLQRARELVGGKA